MARYARTEGILVEAVGHLWAAFSAATGETVMLNDESAAILEILAAGAADSSTICAELAQDSGLPAHEIETLLETCWPTLIDTGLVRQTRTANTMPR